MDNKIKYNVGDVIEVSSAAGPKVYKRVLKKVNRKSTIGEEEIHVVGFEGCFVRRKDLHALKKACVPYNGNEKLKDCVSFTFDWEILRKVRGKKRKEK
jgi:hypothetical protein